MVGRWLTETRPRPNGARRSSRSTFDSFYTTKSVGHGAVLGLATARRIVVDRQRRVAPLRLRPGRHPFFPRVASVRPVVNHLSSTSRS